MRLRRRQRAARAALAGVGAAILAVAALTGCDREPESLAHADAALDSERARADVGGRVVLGHVLTDVGEPIRGA